MKLSDMLQRNDLQIFFDNTKLNLENIDISLFCPPWRHRKAFREIKERTKQRVKLIEKLPIEDYREVGGYYLILKDRRVKTLLETEGEKIRGRLIASIIPKFYASDGKPLLRNIESFKDFVDIAYVVDMHSHPFTFTPSDNDISFGINNLEVCPPNSKYIQGIYGYSGQFLLMEVKNNYPKYLTFPGRGSNTIPSSRNFWIS